MGWFNDDELIRVRIQIEVVRNELQEACRKNKALVKQVDDLFAKAKAADFACSSLLDFDNIDVFSVERNSNRTVIGYWHHSIDSNENEVKTSKEWYFHCNTDVHENIVAQYDRYLKYRNPESWSEEKIDK